MKPISIYQPDRIVFGDGCAKEAALEILKRGHRRVFIVTGPPILPSIGPVVDLLEEKAKVNVFSAIEMEPTFTVFKEALAAARDFQPDAVVGIGGGSCLDVSKLVAALHNGTQELEEVIGIGFLIGRTTFSVCLPTTSGTGSEVSPISVLIDENERLKKGIVSPFVVADSAYVDPLFTHSAPPHVTAATGMDALVHCIEAYANKNSHPLIDVFALEGMRLICANLKRACAEPTHTEARSNMALGSLLGGMCLGPVNTGAVHALAYPLGGEFRIPHGVANSALLPYVLEFNLPAAPQRYAEVATALGAQPGRSHEETAARGLAIVRELSRDIGIPQKLSELGIPQEAIPRIAAGALKVTRLLVNNLREVTQKDAEAIYEAAF